MRDEKEQAVCPICGTRLVLAKRGRPAVYCSRSCQARAYRRRKQHLPSPGAPPAPVPAPARASGTRERQRRRIAEALWHIAAEHGLHAASMRRIADGAGVSLRVVQYHFDSKHALLVDALRLLHEENERLARARVPADTTDPRALLRAVLLEFLPLDEQRAHALKVFAAYYARSLTDPALAAVFLTADQPLERFVADIVETGRAAGMTAQGLDPQHEADLLVSGVTGLGLDVVHERRSLADVRAVLDYHITRVFPPRSVAPA
ncbi:TetR/AcrR family transcriptional regulator [Streptomyces luteoverticillatus]|uniref:TetR/AcrR family transcriptional regulator n=1 Tax=Streptomyces luteoverticillatus TaxID=66425 RepID=A0A3S9PC08_STRLT|nr:TetR/AcrR family transcriptional regulator [Streptomyces luteoverticillatus]AZQ69876.1 TetR/AcrR family transcriptional regulator [Streptomyces luteoverticillatus]